MNIFKKFSTAITKFLKTLIVHIAVIFHEVFNVKAIREDITKAVNDLDAIGRQEHAELKELLARLIQKPHFPVILTNNGKAINLATERGMRMEANYNAQDETLDFVLSVDHREVDRYRILLTQFDDKHPDKPVFDLGRVLLKKRQPGLTDVISAYALTKIVMASQNIERLMHGDVFNLCIFGYLEAIRPYYQQESGKKAIPDTPVEDKANNEDVAISSGKEDVAKTIPSPLQLVDLNNTAEKEQPKEN